MKNRPRKAGKNPAIKHPMRRYKNRLHWKIPVLRVSMSITLFVVLFDTRKNKKGYASHKKAIGGFYHDEAENLYRD